MKLLFLLIGSNKRKSYWSVSPGWSSTKCDWEDNWKYMFFNHRVDPMLKTRDDRVIEPAENFMYLG